MSDHKPTHKPKIYIFANSGAPEWLHVLSVAEDGDVLGGHVCSNMSFAKWDLHDRPDRKARCEAHYPDGYDLMILPLNEFPPDDVAARYKAKAEAAKQSDATADEVAS